MSQVQEFDVPCCDSIRECAERRLVVIGFRKNPMVLREVKAVRCNRGIKKKIRFYPSPNTILIEYYRSNRGVNYITILWKPENVSTEQAIEIAKKALGLSTEETIRIL
jgi:hypothetical protein